MDSPRPSAWRSFWQTVFRFQSEKINPWIGFRNTIGLAVPLAIGAALGNVTGGVIGATGALNVSFRDSSSPYPQRARQMLLASLIAGLAVFSGAVAGHYNALALVIVALWTFAAGMLVSIGDAAADVGTMSVVLLVIYGANPMQPKTAVLAGLTAIAGGLLQTALSIASWPFRRYSPERRVLADLYAEMARTAADPHVATDAPSATPQSLQAQTALASLDRDRSSEGDRYRFLLTQAERIRLSVLALSRIRLRLSREDPVPAGCELLDRALRITGAALESVAATLRNSAAQSSEINELDSIAEQLRAPHAQIADARFQLDALAGQLRAALDIASDQPPESITRVEEAVRPWHLRIGGKLATMIANLNLRSTACRHAIRLAACVVVGEAVGRIAAFPRPYWIPMTIAIVLKPDFGGTFQRGILRLGGTYLGLVLATVAVHAVPDAVGAHIAAIAVLMFVVRCFGPANYGIIVTAISALVVFLISLTGLSAKEVIGARAINTTIGGAIALAAYWLWPTWERYRVAELAATMLEAFRDYFHAIRTGSRVEKPRVAGRLARSNLEASISRASSEPGVSPDRVALLKSMMATSRLLAQSLMSLEAAKPKDGGAFTKFADDLEDSLRRLAESLRSGKPTSLPDLREDHHGLIQNGDRHALTNIEADRIVNSVNTLSEQVRQWQDN